MIYGRGKYLQRVLGLAACNAARDFVSHRLNTRGRRDAWRPMVLRWRQRRRILRNEVAARAAFRSQVSWFPQFHFHFASYMSERTRHNPMTGLAQAAGSQQKRVVMNHRWTSVPTTTLSQQFGNAKQPLREIYEHNSSRPKEPTSMTPAPRVWWPRNNSRSKEQAPGTPAPRVSWSGNGSRAKEQAPGTPAPRVSWLPFAQQLVMWRTRRSRHQLFERTPEVRSRMQREGQTQFLQTHSQIWHHRHQVFSLRQPKFGDPIPHRASGSKTLQFQYERPEELVWRRVLLTPPNTDDDKRGPELSESISRTQTRSQPGHEPAVDVAPLVERAVATQVTKLDPGVLDRLTDDVIRRVEQRLRIERQRRGL